MKKAFDLDGVLAEKPPKSKKKWGRMKGAERKARKKFLIKFYTNAKPLIAWDYKSVIITSRKAESGPVSIAWFQKHYKKIPRIYFLNKSRSLKNVIPFKVDILKLHKITDFYEDNKQVLKGLKEEHPKCKYHYVSETQEISLF